MKLLELPSRLNVTEVVSKWWCRGTATREMTKESTAVLELVASSLNNMPRALEIADTFLRSPANAHRCVNSALIAELFEYVVACAQDRYNPTLPTVSVLDAMFCL